MNIFRAALHRLGLRGELFATDLVRTAPAFHTADRAFEVPKASDPRFISTLLKICGESDIRLIVPTNDHELPAYAEHRDAFRELGTVVAVSSTEVIAIGRDKVQTHDWLVKQGFPTVRQGTPDSVLADPGGWSFPLMTKPRFGSASIGVEVVHDVEQLARVAARDRTAAHGEIVVQELASGDEYTVDILVMSDGGCVCAVPRQRLEVRAGEVSKAMTRRLPKLQRLATRIGEVLPGAFGCLNVQLFYDAASERCAVLEINARFGGGYPLSWEAGAVYPVWMIEELLDRPCSAEAYGWQDGMVMLRYDEAVFVSAADVGL